MTASQRPERVDRDALIEAVVKAVVRQAALSQPWDSMSDFLRDGYRRATSAVLDAALPLIADAIEAELRDTVSPGDPDWCQGYGVGMGAAEALVRSLGDEQ